MGWQSYVLPYETDAQLEALLDLCKLHNSSPPATNVFVRYHEGGEFTQIQTGEELVQPMTATLKKPYKRPRDGPTLSKALLVGNGGGRWCTFGFFTYHCCRLFPREWDASTRIDACAFHEAMDKRLQDKKHIPQERIAGNGNRIVDTDYDVRPALVVTQYHPRALVRTGEMSEAEAAGAGQFVFKAVEDGFVVDEQRFAARSEAEAYAAERKAELARHQAEAKERRAARTLEYDNNRAAGKRLHSVVERLDRSATGHTCKWLTPDEAEAKRAEEGVVSVNVAKSFFVVTRCVDGRETRTSEHLGDEEVDQARAAPGTVAVELEF